MRARLTVLGAALLVSGCGGSGTTTTTTTTTKPPPPSGPAPPATTVSGRVKATLFAPTHEPKINAKWRYRLKVTDRRGRLLRGKVTVQIVDPLGAPHPVQYDDTHRDIIGKPFRGVFHDYVEFPRDSRGQRLTFRVLVKTARGGVDITYPITSR